MRKRPGHVRTQRLRKLPGLHEKKRLVSDRRTRIIRGASRRGAGVDEQAGLENRSPSRDRGFESHPLRHSINNYQTKSGATISSNSCPWGGMRTGVVKGVHPLHGVTGAPRRREGAWPPSGSPEKSSGRLRIPTPSATMRKAIRSRKELHSHQG